MRILGIDPGSLIAGYGIVESGPGGRLIHVCEGQIKTGETRPLPERLLVISKELNSIIEAHGPEAVSIESLFYAKNFKSSVVLGHARGVALLSAASFGLPVFEYAPSAVKLAVTGYGNATKEQVQKMVKALLKTSQSFKADAADALAIAICHIHHCRPGHEKKNLKASALKTGAI